MKRTFCLAMIAAFTSSPAAAQAVGESVFVQLGQWTIVSQPSAQRCEMRSSGRGTGTLTLAKSRGRPGTLELRGGRGSRSFGQITWAFDDTLLQGQKFGSGTYGLVNNTSGVEAEFRRARVLTISDGGQIVGRFPLDSSSSGFRLLNQCADQWRAGFRPLGSRIADARPFSGSSARQNLAASTPRSAPTQQPRASSRSTLRATPPPPVRQSLPAATTAAATPRVSGPFPPNRSATPLNRRSWIEADDISGYNPPRTGFQTLRFTLLVNSDGRVEECAVNSSSGSRSVDRRACRSMQRRARFEPATDANGNAIAGSYSSNVQFAEGG